MKTLIILSLWITLSRQAFAAESTIVVLREDHQVLQRDEHDLAACRVIIPDATAGAKFSIKCADSKEKIILNETVNAAGDDAGGRAVQIDKLPTGGPYKIEIDPADATGINQTYTFDD